MFHIKWNSLGRYYAISAHHRSSHIPFSVLPIHPLNRESTFAKSFTIPATIHGATSSSWVVVDGSHTPRHSLVQHSIHPRSAEATIWLETLLKLRINQDCSNDFGNSAFPPIFMLALIEVNGFGWWGGDSALLILLAVENLLLFPATQCRLLFWCT